MAPGALHVFVGRRGLHYVHSKSLWASALPVLWTSCLVCNRADANDPVLGAIQNRVRVAADWKQVSAVGSRCTQTRELNKEASLLFEPVYEVARNCWACIE